MAYQYEAQCNVIRFAKNKRYTPISVSDLKTFNNKPRGRAVKVANRLLALDLTYYHSQRNKDSTK